jgi:CP family cyanate transporter-like MFS transporter
VLTGLNLRIPVASVPPVIDEISDDLDLSSAAAGLLTSAPILCFGLLAPVAPALARELGGERVLLVALAPILAGVLLRAGPSVATLFAGTLLAGAGVAVANVIVPSVIKGRFEGQEGALTGVYVAILGVGAALAAGLTVPIAEALDAG